MAKKIQDDPARAQLAVVSTEQFVALRQEAAELQELVEEFFKDGLSENDLPLIKIPAGGGRSWELSESENAPTFTGCILGIQNTRAYWAEAFTGAGTPAACSSRDGVTGVGEPGGTCARCPLGEWGSGRGGVGTACLPRKIVYVLRPEEVLPVRLALPVTSFVNLRKYQVALLNRRVRPSAVSTLFGLTSAQSKTGIKYSQATFTVAGALDAETAGRARAYAALLTASLGQTKVENQAEEPPAAAEIDDEDVPVSWK